MINKLILPFLSFASLVTFAFSEFWSLLFLCILFIYLYIKNEGPILIIILFLFITTIPFFLEVLNIKTTYYNQFYSEDYYSNVYLSYLIFLLIFLSGVNGLNIKTNYSTGKYRKKDIYHKFCLFLLFFILLFGKTGETILTGSYGKLETSGIPGLAINEYYLLFSLIMLFIYKPKKYVHVLSVLFIIKNLLFGGRIEVLQMIFLYIIFLNINLKSIKNLLVSLLLVISFDLIGNIRTLGLSLESFMFLFSKLSIFNLEFLAHATSTFGEVIYTSSIIQASITDNIISFHDRIPMVLQHLLSYIFPYSTLSKNANISLSMQSISDAGGGGLVSAYFYFIGGLPVVILGSFCYMKIFKKMHTSKTYILNSIGLLMIITSPRWLIYNHVTFLKSSFYLFIILFFFYRTRIINR